MQVVSRSMSVAVLVVVAALLASTAGAAKSRLVRDPPSPDQPADFVITIANYCNSTMTLDTQNYNLWEGSYAVEPVRTSWHA